MTNRAPTPLELGCADPNNPCMIDNFLVPDPPLKQVVGKTFELGFRGTNASQFVWPNGASCNGRRGSSAPRSPTTSCRCRARLPASAITPMSGRRCARARSSASSGPATGGRLTPTTPISTPSISRPSWSRRRTIRWPTRTANIPITNGTPIAGIPKNTLKVGVDYAVTDKWHIGADMVAASGQVIFGNENGAVPQVPGYAIFGLHTSYQDRQAVADLWPRPEHFRSALLYRRRPCSTRRRCPMTAPDLTNPQTPRACEAFRHLRRSADHDVMLGARRRPLFSARAGLRRGSRRRANVGTCALRSISPRFRTRLPAFGRRLRPRGRIAI